MKITKRLLAAVLTMALALGLALPAMAAVDWDAFKITKQPQDLTIKHGDSFTLSVEVSVPAGVEVEYQWYRWMNGGGPKPIDGETAAIMIRKSNDSDYPSENRFYEYHCEITAHEEGTGNLSKLTSNKARVDAEEKEKDFLGKVYSVTVEPFVYAGKQTATSVLLSFGFLIPLAPVWFLFFLVEGFINGFRGLF